MYIFDRVCEIIYLHVEESGAYFCCEIMQWHVFKRMENNFLHFHVSVEFIDQEQKAFYISKQAATSSKGFNVILSNLGTISCNFFYLKLASFAVLSYQCVRLYTESKTAIWSVKSLQALTLSWKFIERTISKQSIHSIDPRNSTMFRYLRDLKIVSLYHLFESLATVIGSLTSRYVQT